MEPLYFIAIIPPEDTQTKISRLKQEVAEKFGSKHALNAPSHITIHMPFRLKDKKIGKLKGVMDQINGNMEPFEVELKDFGFFEPRVVFVNVLENRKLELLQKEVVNLCRKELNLDNANYRNQPFHPHITIAFRDLKKPNFYQAREYYINKKHDSTFTVEQVSLLKHDGKKWQVSVF